MSKFPLIIYGKPPIITKPSEASFYHPSVFGWHEPSLGRGMVLADFQHSFESLFDKASQEIPSKTLVSHYLFDTGFLHSLAILGQHFLAALGIVAVGSGHGNIDQQAKAIGRNKAFAALHTLAAVIPSGLSASTFARFDALTVNYEQRGLLIPTGGFSHHAIKVVVDFPPSPPFLQFGKVAVHRSPRRKVLGQPAPFAAVRHHIHDGIDYPAHVCFPRTATVLRPWDVTPD